MLGTSTIRIRQWQISLYVGLRAPEWAIWPAADGHKIRLRSHPIKSPWMGCNYNILITWFEILLTLRCSEMWTYKGLIGLLIKLFVAFIATFHSHFAIHVYRSYASSVCSRTRNRMLFVTTTTEIKFWTPSAHLDLKWSGCRAFKYLRRRISYPIESLKIIGTYRKPLIHIP